MALINLNQKNNQNSQVEPSLGKVPNSATPMPNQAMDVKQDTTGVKEYTQPQANSAPPVPQKDVSDDLLNKITAISNELGSTSTPPIQDHVNIPATEVRTDQPSIQNLSKKTYSLAEIIKSAIDKKASDLHLTVNYRPLIRIDSKLEPLNVSEVDKELMITYVKEFIKDRSNIDLANLKEIDFGYDFQGRRLRVNIFKQRNTFSVAARIIPDHIMTLEELGLPAIMKDFASSPGGLILVTGPTGSGKSTTLTAILDYINKNFSKHIITLEDPIEFVFPTGKSLIDQREFGRDFDNWASALKATLRQDPNVVLIGEMRDLETISSAMTISETGHLVFGTLHTNSASQTIDRIIDVFPQDKQSQIRSQLANVITAVISQRLVPLPSGGRTAVTEIMVASAAVRAAIRESKTYQIDNMIQTGQDFGMISMEKSLASLVQKGIITPDVAKSISTKPEEIDMLVNRFQ